MISGFMTLLRGMALLLRNRALWPVSFLPIFLTALLWFGLLYAGWWSWNGWVEPWLEADQSGWWATLEPVLFLGALFVFLAIAFFLFSLVGSLVLIPFMEPIARRADRAYREQNPTARAVAGSGCRPTMDGLMDGVRMVRYKVTVLGLLAPVLVIPVIGPLIFVLVNGYLSGVDIVDVALSTKEFTWEEKSRAWKSNRVRICGLDRAAGRCPIKKPPFARVLSCERRSLFP